MPTAPVRTPGAPSVGGETSGTWRTRLANGAGAIVAWVNARTWWVTVLLWSLGFWLLIPTWIVNRTGASRTGLVAAGAVLLGFLLVGAVGDDARDAATTASPPAAGPSEADPAAPTPDPTTDDPAAPTPSPTSTSTPSRIPPPSGPSPSPTSNATGERAATGASPRGDDAPVTRQGGVGNIVDGDTIDLADGTRVRIAIVDTPEVHGGFETCGPEASDFTGAFVAGETVAIYRPAGVPSTDGFGRTLGEVVRLSDGASLNVALVRAGLGTIDQRFVTEDPDLARRLRAAAASAGRPPCRGGTPVDPEPDAQPRGDQSAGRARQHTGNTDGGYPCEPAYRECLPQVDDLDCSGIGHQVTLFGASDPYDLDGNGDLVGCQSQAPWSPTASYPYS